MDIQYLDLARITALHAEEYSRVANDIIRSGQYLNGPRVHTFEQEFAAYTSQSYCVSCASGLDALTLMIRAYTIMDLLRPGDEIIVPANTFIATLLAITYNHLTPILVEPRITDFQIDDSLIERAITPRTRAIMIVHLYGYCALTPKIVDICTRHNLLLLQDCAQAHGLNHVCSLPPTSHLHGASAYSFYPGKNLGATADAGAVTTEDEQLSHIVRSLANYGAREKNTFQYLGHNSRMDELTAAFLSTKLQYLDQDNRRRQEIAEQYIEGINNPLVTLPPSHGIHHIFPILSPERDRLRDHLAHQGVHTLIHYPIPPHHQECYPEWNHISLPITEQIHREELSLPLHQALTPAEVAYIIQAINSFA